MKRVVIHFLAFAVILSFLTSGQPLSSSRPAVFYANQPASVPHAQQEILLAAAADLKFAMDSLITVFSAANPGVTVKASYGASGNFFAQITNGAPYDLFFSADMDYPKKLAEQQLTLGAVKQYAIGQIVLWSKELDPAQDKMNTLLNSAVKKIAIANPAHAPYGKRAKESLIYYKLYDQVKDKLVFGENISQTAEFVSSGAADIGIVALSLASSPAMRSQGGKYWLIPPEAHQPLQQGYTLLQHAKGNAGAEQFSDFMSAPKAAAILKFFGLGN